jgi:hypothetical protein
MRCCAGLLFLSCGLAGCTEPSREADTVANGAVTPSNPSKTASQSTPAATGNSASRPASAADDGIGGRELAEGSANLDFILVNHTGQTITALSISPHGEESWTRNILASRDVPPDERAAASFARDVEICSWDVRATYEGGHRQSWPRINLCDTIRVELR